ncbi:MAG: aldo/keto reductase, partial [Betaproteobacteria bacterium]|nr:aldo/keto reductase [Betaproteobacteria bacterium]
MITRRTMLLSMAGAALAPRVGLAATPALITRAIPKSGERLPVIGLGSSATFSRVARSEDVSALRAVLAKLVEMGGTVFDTAPAYGASEEVAGRIAQELGIAQKLFWATKLNVAGWGGGSADPA